MLEELVRDRNKLNDLNEIGIEGALENRFDKKYLNLKTCTKRH